MRTSSSVSLIEGGLRRVAENRIESAILEGAFDNLPGRGKPLPADRLCGVDSSWRLAFRVLDSAGFAPQWVELGQEICAQLRSALARSTSPQRS